MEKTFTGVFEKVGNWYMAYAEELPGANTQGRTLGEARENLREAIELVLAAKRALSRWDETPGTDAPPAVGVRHSALGATKLRR